MQAIPWTLALLLAAALPASWQDEKPGQDEKEADPQAAAQAWVDALVGEDGALSPAELERGLAEIELSVAVDRDFRGADHRLERLRRLAESAMEDEPSSHARREAVLRALIAHVELQVARGHLRDAWNELDDPDELVSEGWEDVELAAWRAIAEDERVARLREDVQRRLEGDPREAAAGEPGRDPEDPVAEAVEDALAWGNVGFLRELGTVAVPHLVRRVRSGLGAFPLEPVNDPLAILFSIDPRRGARLALETYEQDAPLWHQRLLRAATWKSPDVMWDDTTTPPTARYPELLEVLVRLTDEGELGKQAWEELKGYVRNHEGWPAPPVGERIVAAFGSEDEAERQRAFAALSGATTYEEVLPLYEAALLSPDETIRAWSAQAISRKFMDSTVLLGRADDPNPEVREAVARLLRYRKVHDPVTGVWHEPEPEASPEVRAALETLLRDELPDIRGQALLALKNTPVVQEEITEPGSTLERELLVLELDPSIFEALARDADLPVRQTLTDVVALLPTAVRGRVLATLLLDESLGVVNRAFLNWQAIPISDSPADWVAIFARRARNPHHPLTSSDSLIHEFFRRAKAHPEARALLVGELAELGDADLTWAFLVDRPEWGNLDGPLLQLPPDSYVDLVRLADSFGATRAYAIDLLDRPDPTAGRLFALAREQSVSPEVRLRCATASPVRLKAGWEEAMARILADPWWSEHSIPEQVVKHYQVAPGEVRGRLIAKLLEDPAVAEETAATFVRYGFNARAPGSADIARRVLERWFGVEDGQVRRAVTAVLQAMASSPELRDDALLARALEVPAYRSTVVSVVERLRDPALFPLLAEVVHNYRDDDSLFAATVRAIASFLTEEAAELLIEAATLTNRPSVRDTCMNEVDKIRRFHEARDYWRRGRAIERSREGAIAELVELLEDSDEAVRIQAIRSLATFEAVEVLPNLIRRMKGASETERAEIVRALERIQAAGVPPKPSGATGDSEDG